MTYSIKLGIADIIFEFFCPDIKLISWLKNNYETFVTDKPCDYKVFVRKDKKQAQRADLPAQAGLYSQPNVRWNKESFSAKRKNFDVDINFKDALIQVKACRKAGIVDLVRFLINIILIRKKGLLLHAGAILHRGSVYVFVGHSESGKTTIARLSKGMIVLTDESTAIVKRRVSYYAYATPFAGEFGQVKQNMGAPIKCIFFINKSHGFGHRGSTPSEAVQKLFCSAIIDINDLKTVNFLFDALTLLATQIPCYELYFKPKPQLWSYIDGFIQ